ncbi:hypothetical protein OS493_009403 [Desmophyllum pertusum]|uniref:Uncharacterized protein n=1 Tax=Desmophyllum pertusum TaxID=174260 RepID=A0A9W9Z2R8_9CNID|nr:hypothetical protein OS493_009403 [Desmophyllum pertusum]
MLIKPMIEKKWNLKRKELGYDDITWDENGGLYIRQKRSAFLTHPVTGEKIWLTKHTATMLPCTRHSQASQYSLMVHSRMINTPATLNTGTEVKLNRKCYSTSGQLHGHAQLDISGEAAIY